MSRSGTRWCRASWARSRRRAATRKAPTVRDLAERFIEEYSKTRNKPRTVETCQGYLRLHILPALGNREVVEAVRADVTALLHQLARLITDDELVTLFHYLDRAEREQLEHPTIMLAVRLQFTLSGAQWQAFQEALDRPVQSKPRLKKLLREPGVLG